MTIISPPGQSLKGFGAFVTSVHHVRVPSKELLQQVVGAAALEIGEDVLILEDTPDDLGNVAVYVDRTRGTVRAHESCLTLIPSQPAPRLHPSTFITREVAAHVLYVFNGTGYRAGSFISAIIDAANRADPGHLRLLALGFPGYAEAVRIAQMDPNGLEWLAAKMRGEERLATLIKRIDT